MQANLCQLHPRAQVDRAILPQVEINHGRRPTVGCQVAIQLPLDRFENGTSKSTVGWRRYAEEVKKPLGVALEKFVKVGITLHGLKLLPNAKAAEDDVEEVLDVDTAGDFAEGFGGLAEFQR